VNIDLLSCSFQAVQPRARELTTLFYATLFDRNPGVRKLFPTSMEAQQGKLAEALATIVGAVEKPDVFEAFLLDLGARHNAYGAEPAHYAAVADAMLYSLESIAGPLWTSELAETWKQALQAVAEVMQRGQAGEPA